MFVVYSKYYFLNFIKFSWNCSLKFSRRQNVTKFYICSKFRHYASICIGVERLENRLERSCERPLKNGRSVERIAWSGMQQKGLERRSGKSPRSAPLTCSGVQAVPNTAQRNASIPVWTNLHTGRSALESSRVPA